jgi:hypothetical protein
METLKPVAGFREREFLALTTGVRQTASARVQKNPCRANI